MVRRPRGLALALVLGWLGAWPAPAAWAQPGEGLPPGIERPAAPAAPAPAPGVTPAGPAGTRLLQARTLRDGTQVRAVQRDFASGVRASLRTQTHELPAAEHRDRRVEFHERDDVLVRRTTIDGPVGPNGTFQRTTRSLVLTQTPGRASNGPAPWTRKPGDLTPRWRARDVDALVSSKPLGPSYRDPASVKVRLFAPYARKVQLVLDDTGERMSAVPDRAGVWEAATGKAAAALYGKRYHFEVDGESIADPYGHSATTDYGPSRFVDLGKYQWHDQDFKPQARPTVISEVHVRDMTASATSPVDPRLRGTYLGFASKAITDHYNELGVSTVEMLPVHAYDDASGDRGTMNHWGYMTTGFFAPEQRYALNNETAHEELQKAVDNYHQKGISVVMDVVFNHTATGDEIAFKTLGKTYYYRVKPDGKLANGAGTGNEFASERPMVQKLIVDSLQHFVENYHVDGFRFDLGSILDVQTMRLIDRRLPPRVFLTSEPWAAEWDRAKWGKGDLSGSLSGTRWSVWNDDYRNAVNGFMTGSATGPDAKNRLMTAIAGSAKPYGFALRPSQSVNYIESHDELSTIDRVGGDKARSLVGGVLLMTSQGTPMLGHGQEIGRTKQGIANAHNLDNEVSHIDWSLKEKNADMFGVYKRLIELRRDLPQFKYDHPLTDKEIKWISPEHGDQEAIGYLLPAPPPAAGAARAPDVAVLANSDRNKSAWFKLPPGEWKIVVHGTKVGADYRNVSTANGYYEVQPGTAAVVTQLAPR